jgi:hypothetical protein
VGSTPIKVVDAHQRDGDEQDLLAADPVTHTAEVDRAGQPGDVADSVGRHRGDQADGRADVREEDLVEDDGGRQRVQLEVHELHRRAEPPRHRSLGEITRRPRYGTLRRSVHIVDHRCVPCS